MPLNKAEKPHWLKEVRHAYRTMKELQGAIGMPDDPDYQGKDFDFPVFVPQSFAKKIQPNLDDPIWLQVAANIKEKVQQPDEFEQPLDEDHFKVGKFILQKYFGRVLILTTSQCVVHCRYCFRQNFGYESASESEEQLKELKKFFDASPDIHEVILSGGDPLSLTNERLKKIVDLLATYDFLKTIRVHTRVPVILPSRVDSQFLEIFDQDRWNLVLVLHSNHPHEIAHGDVEEALAKLNQKFRLLNQSVLLKGVNDCAKVLAELSHQLHQSRVLPYYIHQLDRVIGSDHFFVDQPTAQRIMSELRSTLPGYLVPKYVAEIPGESSKSPIP